MIPEPQQPAAIKSYQQVFSSPIRATIIYHTEGAVLRYVLDPSFLEVCGLKLIAVATNRDTEAAVRSIQSYVERVQNLIKINNNVTMMRVGYSRLISLHKSLPSLGRKIGRQVDREVLDELQSYEAGLAELVRKADYLDRGYFKRNIIDVHEELTDQIWDIANEQSTELAAKSRDFEFEKKLYTELLSYACLRSLKRKMVVLTNNRGLNNALENLHGLIVKRYRDQFKGGLETVMDA